MQRIPDSPPHIPVLDTAVPRVLWSVMIPVYNCASYLREALESVLMQDLGLDAMQIEVVDDGSTDADVEGLVKAIGKGRINYYRQPENVGSLRNFETCINRSRGYYIHLLHGDDKVKTGFYQEITNLLTEFPETGAAICAWNCINENGEVIKTSVIKSATAGILNNAFEMLLNGQITQYVSTVVKREVYEKLGSFYGVTYGEDLIMWARIAKHYDVVYIPQVLAEYRVHNISISGIGALNGDNFKDVKKAAQIISSLAPLHRRKKVVENIRRNYTYWALNELYTTWANTENVVIVFKRFVPLMKGFKDRKIIIMFAKLWLSIIKHAVKK